LFFLFFITEIMEEDETNIWKGPAMATLSICGEFHMRLA
jgi:hypothetical protein